MRVTRCCRNCILLPLNLGIDADQLAILTDRIVAEWQGWGKILDVPTQALPPFAEIAAAMPASGGLAEQSDNQAAPLRIMVVDDQASTCHFMQAILADAGHQVMTANNGKEALSVALEFIPSSSSPTGSCRKWTASPCASRCVPPSLASAFI
jgi:hypothetical protein